MKTDPVDIIDASCAANLATAQPPTKKPGQLVQQDADNGLAFALMALTEGGDLAGD